MMTRAVFVLAAAGLLAAGARAQPGPTPGQSRPQSGPAAGAAAPGWQPWFPGAGRPSPTPGTSVPQTPAGGATVAAPAVGAGKVCVAEPKPTTKVVYGSVCQEYCTPRCGSVLGLLKELAGFGDGHGCCRDGCTDCELRTRRVLVKKVVPGPDAPACVLKEAPCGPACPPVLPPIPIIPPPAVMPPPYVLPTPARPPVTATPYR